MATTDTTSIPEKGNGGNANIQSKAAHHGKHAYEHTIIGKETAVGPHGTAPGIYTNPEPGHQPSVPNIYTPAPTRGKNIKHVKEEVSSVPEKSIGGDNKNRSKAAHPGKHAYEQTIIGKEAAAGPYGTAASIYTNPQPAAAEPRYLRVGDHVVVYSGQESGKDCGYRVAEEVSKGYEEDHYYSDYEKPEDVHTYEGFEENHSSHDYDKPEDVYGYKDPEEESFACRAKGLVVGIWKKWKSSRVCWFALGCGLLVVASVIISVILATHIAHGGRVALQQNVTSMVLNPLQGLSSSPWQTAFYGENNSAFDDFKVVNSTPTFLPSTNSIVTTEALSTTVTSLSTTDVNEFNVVDTTPTYLPSTNSIVTAEALPSTVTSLSTTALRCQTGWSEYNNRCYKLMRDKTCWSKAKKRCAKHDALLATIKDANENSFIADLIVNGG
ncbi:PREDICTED: uncharacterized protein LOC109472526 [Branchiostoma belcheri]|uniref:Uncharacterized protein LOC109472526 n=1 Tax=Branchiostoma belcheri TaxID=7741 RepID=A0A6P4Z9V1_BRABE|nr:PREDICTED: uncharacterized protein LOC109472526 [Branchiostoma belcheri]